MISKSIAIPLLGALQLALDQSPTGVEKDSYKLESYSRCSG